MIFSLNFVTVYSTNFMMNIILRILLHDSKTLMFAMVSPVDFNAEETFSTLSFAVRVRKVELGQASKQGGSISGVAAATKAAGVLKKKAGRKKSSR